MTIRLGVIFEILSIINWNEILRNARRIVQSTHTDHTHTYFSVTERDILTEHPVKKRDMGRSAPYKTTQQSTRWMNTALVTAARLWCIGRHVTIVCDRADALYVCGGGGGSGRRVGGVTVTQRQGDSGHEFMGATVRCSAPPPPPCAGTGRVAAPLRSCPTPPLTRVRKSSLRPPPPVPLQFERVVPPRPNPPIPN